MPRNTNRRRSGGFTLLEIMIVAGIIGLLGAMAMQTMRAVRDASRRNATANDLRVFAGAFEQYATEHGAWPDDGSPGVFPEVMDGVLSRNGWTRKAPWGGHYDWDRDVGGIRASIAIRDTGGMFPSLDQMARLDAVIDDGDLNAGTLRLSSFGGIAYILEE